MGRFETWEAVRKRRVNHSSRDAALMDLGLPICTSKSWHPKGLLNVWWNQRITLMDTQMYRQHCARARSSFSHVKGADLASLSILLSRYTQRTSAVRRVCSFTIINVLELPDSNKPCCFMSTPKVAVCPNRVTSKVQKPKERSGERRKENSPQFSPPWSWWKCWVSLGEVSLISLSPWEPHRGGSAAWLLCYMLALIKGKYASMCRTLLFICACNALLWCHADSSEMFWCRSFAIWKGATCSRAWRSCDRGCLVPVWSYSWGDLWPLIKSCDWGFCVLYQFALW